jgi:hypothetical protein
MIKNYMGPLLMLSLGVLTRNAFSRNFSDMKENKDLSFNLGIDKKSKKSLKTLKKAPLNSIVEEVEDEEAEEEESLNLTKIDSTS